MNVVMAFNTGFLLPAITAVYSLFINNDDIHLRILYVDLSDSSKIVLDRLTKLGMNNSIEYIRIEGELLKKIKVQTGRWRQETFFRYYVTEVLPELDRVLWLDADILVRGSIKELYNTDFEGKSFAGVWDVTSNPSERLGLEDYINAGILLINANKLKKTGRIAEFWKLVASPDYAADLPDQDALNIVFNKDIKIIDIIWNTFLYVPEEHVEVALDMRQLVAEIVVVRVLEILGQVSHPALLELFGVRVVVVLYVDFAYHHEQHERHVVLVTELLDGLFTETERNTQSRQHGEETVMPRYGVRHLDVWREPEKVVGCIHEFLFFCKNI